MKNCTKIHDFRVFSLPSSKHSETSSLTTKLSNIKIVIRLIQHSTDVFLLCCPWKNLECCVVSCLYDVHGSEVEKKWKKERRKERIKCSKEKCSKIVTIWRHEISLKAFFSVWNSPKKNEERDKTSVKNTCFTFNVLFCWLWRLLRFFFIFFRRRRQRVFFHIFIFLCYFVIKLNMLCWNVIIFFFTWERERLCSSG